ncbi:MAG: hypothetical protein TYPL_3990 [Candidatus Tyloplasma litorale]|nr:MAG: hypothetical protein TYPL_3990 [Mycoplasmatales bacterium]
MILFSILLVLAIFSLVLAIFFILIIRISFFEKAKVQTLDERKDFETKNEYLKKFITIFDGNNSNYYFFSGPAGSGKSTFINEFTKYLNLEYQITSTTGISVVNFENGMTIHSFSGIGNKKSLDDINKILNSKKYKQEIKLKLQKIDVLIIDEISILSYMQFDLLNKVLQDARNNNEYFGGVKLILFGDFLQLPPISKNGFFTPWIFKSRIWESMNFVYLTLNKHYRQKDKDFIRHLNRLRIGITNKDDINYFHNLKNESKSESLNLRAKKDEVDSINNKFIESNNNKSFLFKSKIYSSNWDLYKNEINSFKETFSERLIIKKGIRVIHLKNDFDNKLVNGSLGTIKHINYSKIIVDWDGVGEQKLNFYKHTLYEFNNPNKIALSFKQLPIKPAYAITIHKSQGMTLDSFDVDCKNIFADGQTYVALSRGKDALKINVQNISIDKIKTNKEALGFYFSKNKKFIPLGESNFSKFNNLNEISIFKTKIYKSYINNIWRDEKWVQENLINTKLINQFEYKYYMNQAGIYKITILDHNNENRVYIGQSQNLIQRLCYHVSNAFDDKLKLKKKQQVSKTIRKYGLKNIKFEILTSRNWFIGKYITEEDWNLLETKQQDKLLKNYLFYEENIEIEKLKKRINNRLIENRTNGL